MEKAHQGWPGNGAKLWKLPLKWQSVSVYVILRHVVWRSEVAAPSWSTSVKMSINFSFISSRLPRLSWSKQPSPRGSFSCSLYFVWLINLSVIKMLLNNLCYVSLQSDTWKSVYKLVRCIAAAHHSHKSPWNTCGAL